MTKRGMRRVEAEGEEGKGGSGPSLQPSEKPKAVLLALRVKSSPY